MSRPEASDNVSDYAPRGASDFYRHGRAGAAIGEGPKGDLSRLRQSLGPEPEVVHVPQPTRRVGWFASGFAIALVVGIVAGWLVLAAVSIAHWQRFWLQHKDGRARARKIAGGSERAWRRYCEYRPASDSIECAKRRCPGCAGASQPASSAPARVATAEPAPAVRGVTDTEIRFESRHRSAARPRNSART